MTEPEKETMYCSFCGKSQHEVSKLIAGPTSFICNECVVLCNEIIGPSAPVSTISLQDTRERIEQFNKDYGISCEPDLRQMASMAYVFGIELGVSLKKKQVCDDYR